MIDIPNRYTSYLEEGNRAYRAAVGPYLEVGKVLQVASFREGAFQGGMAGVRALVITSLRGTFIYAAGVYSPPNGGGGKEPGGPEKGGGGPKCWGPNPNPPGGGPPPDSYAAVIWSMMFCALSCPRAN